MFLVYLFVRKTSSFLGELEKLLEYAFKQISMVRIEITWVKGWQWNKKTHAKPLNKILVYIVRQATDTDTLEDHNK